tara:strand:+ start:246 stop:461 length:216 start_codon:yes stop_codon:yes gene_type:complete
MKIAILNALEAKYEAQVAEAHATIKIYLENSVGIGEHPQHIEEIDKQLQKIADAEEKLSALEDFREERNEE